ncbi:MAG: protein phosphatase CheZ [Xanthobacteraceae bacterium]|nr:protein phosphatase CheZ [Xanthobacteraceae bacterium]
MPLPPASQTITETDYEAIEAAVKETARGRWFLDEFAQRNRNADTRLVLDAIARLQRSVLGAEPVSAPAPQIPVIRDDLNEIERTAEKTRAALREIDAAHQRDGDLGNELDLVVAASAQAVSGVLSDADRIAEISATMRAQGIAEYICDQLDGLSEHINTACAFQDLTGQRTQKVVIALRLLESRIHEVVELWQAESPVQAPAKNELLSGPAREGEGLMQDQIDELLSIDQSHDIFWDEKAAAATPAKTETAPQGAAPAKNASGIEKLSPEERLALFS